MRRERAVARRIRRAAMGGLLAGIVIGIGIIPAVAATITINPGDDIQTAIDGATPGDTIQLTAGVHNVVTTIDINKSVIIEGIGAATVQGTTIDARNVFKITASNVTLQDLDITLSTTYPLAPKELDDSLIIVPASAGLSGVVISGNALHWPAQAGAMSGWGGRAITIGSSGATDIAITGNTVFNTRNGIVLHYGNVGTVSDNLVYNTKGGIMQYTSNQADADNRTMTGNTWGTAHNEWDIVWNSANYDPDYADSVLGVSIANSEGYVVDRRDAAGGHAVGNRSHIFISSATGLDKVHEALGNMNDPFATFAFGVEAVVADGDIYVDVGAYQEQVVLGKNLEILGSGLSTIIQSPDTLTQYFTAGTKKNYPIVYVHDADNVAIRDLVVDGLGKGNANYGFVGIAFFNAGGAVSDVEVRGIQDTPFSGAQHGVAIYAFNEDGDPRTLEIVDSAIHDFQKNAMALKGAGLTVNVEGNTITGAGPTGVTAQNGIQVSDGAGGAISGNILSDVWWIWPGTGTNWTATGILVSDGAPGIEVVNNSLVNCQAAIHFDSLGGLVAGNTIDGSSWSLKVYQLNAAVLSNTISNSYVGVYLPAGSADVRFNTIIGNDYGVYLPTGSTSSTLNFNSIESNDYGILSYGALSDVTLNWWGSADGPWVDLDFDDIPEYEGAGDSVYGNVIFSPWLGTDPDGDPVLPGVQIEGPVTIIVAPVGPEPAGGYLNAGIAGANDLPFADTIEVWHGTYDASATLEDAVTLVSEVGSAANTILNGPITIDAADILLGRIGQGFTINGPITVGAGRDASTIHINWNDIFDFVINNGDNTLDATFNYWGEDGPDTIGLVAINPILPESSDIIVGYMADFDLNALQAIDFSYLLDELNKEKRALVAIELMATFGFTVDEALELIDTYGWSHVRNALRWCDGDYDQFLVLLVGYAVGGHGGGGGGAAGEIDIYTAGDIVPLVLELLNPITGEVVDDALVSYSVCQTLPDGTVAIVAFGVMTYDSDLGAFTFNVDTTGYEPGIYDVYLGTDDGRSQHFQIEVTAD